MDRRFHQTRHFEQPGLQFVEFFSEVDQDLLLNIPFFNRIYQ
jgi:hypothetical protein